MLFALAAEDLIYQLTFTHGRVYLDIQFLTHTAQAFFVHCNATTNPPDTVAVGQVIAEIGVAPSKPAEFVVFRFKQFAGKATA